MKASIEINHYHCRDISKLMGLPKIDALGYTDRVALHQFCCFCCYFNFFLLNI